ncbi:MAG: zf-HC2 domain-containing protein [Terriglobales bacterium]
MTTISCHQFTDWSSELLDGELAPAEAAAARAHAEACPRCHAVWVSLQATVSLLGNEACFAAPAGVHERLQAALAAGLEEPLTPAELRPAQPRLVSTPSGSRSSWSPARLRLASGLVAVILIAAAVGLLRVRAAAITTSGWLIDTHCLSSDQAKLAVHTSTCLIKCAQQNPVGIVDAKGHFLRFDARGRRRVLAEVIASQRPDHLWVTVRGKRAGTAAVPVLDVEQVELTRPGTNNFSDTR